MFRIPSYRCLKSRRKQSLLWLFAPLCVSCLPNKNKANNLNLSVLFPSFKAGGNMDLCIEQGIPSFIPFPFHLQKVVGKKKKQKRCLNLCFFFPVFEGLFSSFDSSLGFEKWHVCKFLSALQWLWECWVGTKIFLWPFSLIKLHCAVPVGPCRSSRFTAPNPGWLSGVLVCGIH